MTVIQNDPFAINGMEDAVEPGTVEIERLLRYDDQADLHPKAPQNTVREATARLLVRRVDDDREIDIAIEAMIAAGPRSKQHDPVRIGRLDNAAHRLPHLFVGD
jgi:hypothetical protein